MPGGGSTGCGRRRQFLLHSWQGVLSAEKGSSLTILPAQLTVMGYSFEAMLPAFVVPLCMGEREA